MEAKRAFRYSGVLRKEMKTRKTEHAQKEQLLGTFGKRKGEHCNRGMQRRLEIEVKKNILKQETKPGIHF